MLLKCRAKNQTFLDFSGLFWTFLRLCMPQRCHHRFQVNRIPWHKRNKMVPAKWHGQHSPELWFTNLIRFSKDSVPAQYETELHCKHGETHCNASKVAPRSLRQILPERLKNPLCFKTWRKYERHWKTMNVSACFGSWCFSAGADDSGCPSTKRQDVGGDVWAVEAQRHEAECGKEQENEDKASRSLRNNAKKKRDTKHYKTSNITTMSRWAWQSATWRCKDK